MNGNGLSVVTRLPYEVLHKIFKFLDPKTLTASRAVCRRWRQIIDDNIASNEGLWRKNCEIYYSNIWHSAHVNSITGLSWNHLFKSLTLWTKLARARDTIIEFFVAKLVRVANFQVHRNGVLGVLTRNSIMYYNIKTLQPYQEIFVADNCTGYRENDDLLLLLNERLELNIIWKETHNIIGKFEYVNAFLIISNVVYYVTTNNVLYKCALVDGSYTATLLTQFSGTVLSLGHENGILYTLVVGVDCCNVYSFVNDVQVPVLLGASRRDVFQALTRYDFINHTDWEFFFDTVRVVLSEDIEELPLYNLEILHIHGPVLFAGYSPGILCIFYSLYTSDVVDLLRSTPCKVCYLYEPHEATFNYTYLNIAVVEGEEGHTVLVAMLKRVVAIMFTHPPSNDENGTCPDGNITLPDQTMQANCNRIQSSSWGETIVNWNLLINSWELSISNWQPFASNR